MIYPACLVKAGSHLPFCESRLRSCYADAVAQWCTLIEGKLGTSHVLSAAGANWMQAPVMGTLPLHLCPRSGEFLDVGAVLSRVSRKGIIIGLHCSNGQNNYYLFRIRDRYTASSRCYKLALLDTSAPSRCFFRSHRLYTTYT